MVNWLSLTFPIAYIGILIGSLATFSSLYRKRKAGKLEHPPFNLNTIASLPRAVLLLVPIRYDDIHSVYSSISNLSFFPLAKSTSLTPWFRPHLQRDIYLSLTHLHEEPNTSKKTTTTSGSSSTKEKKAPAVPETVLKAALLRRAAEDIHRLMELRSQKPALAGLLQKGSVGDDLWQRFLRAEKEMEEEVRDVVGEVCSRPLFSFSFLLFLR